MTACMLNNELQSSVNACCITGICQSWEEPVCTLVQKLHHHAGFVDPNRIEVLHKMSSYPWDSEFDSTKLEHVD